MQSALDRRILLQRFANQVFEADGGQTPRLCGGIGLRCVKRDRNLNLLCRTEAWPQTTKRKSHYCPDQKSVLSCSDDAENACLNLRQLRLRGMSKKGQC